LCVGCGYVAGEYRLSDLIAVRAIGLIKFGKVLPQVGERLLGITSNFFRKAVEPPCWISQVLSRIRERIRGHGFLSSDSDRCEERRNGKRPDNS
jgi:hypothetical protein